MTTFDELLSWDSENLYKAGYALLAESNCYKHVHDNLLEMRFEHFEGKSAEAEQRKRRILADDAADLQRSTAKAGKRLMDAAETATVLRRKADSLKQSIDSEKGAPFTIVSSTDDYHIDTTPSEDAQSAQGKYGNQLRHLKMNVESTVTFIRSVFDDLIGNINNTAIAPRKDVVERGTSAAPDPSWTVDDVNDWWTSLSEKEQKSIIQAHPDWIGNLNGIPMAVRDQANRKRLPEIRKKIDEEVEKFEPKYEYVSEGTAEPTILLNPEYKKLLEKQKDIHALERSINSEDSNNIGRTLLLLDDSPSDRLRAAIGSGDIDHADHVMTLTPGMGSRVSTTLATEDGGRGSGVEYTENVLEESGLSWKRNDGDHSKGTAAGVTWLGYDAPPDLVSASSSQPAQDAGSSLASFQDGIQATHDGDPHLVSISHSYGTVVNGYALQQTNSVDEVVVTGSPGLRTYAGGSTVNASDLHMLPGDMFAADAEFDKVPYSTAHGRNPANDPGSEFVALETGGKHGLDGVTGHTDYFKPGTTVVHDMGQILRNEEPSYYAQTSPTLPFRKQPWRLY